MIMKMSVHYCPLTVCSDNIIIDYQVPDCILLVDIDRPEVCKLSKTRCKSIGPSREVTNTELARPGLSGAGQTGAGLDI